MGKKRGAKQEIRGGEKQEEEEEEEGGSPEEPRGARNETKEFRQVKGYSSGLFRAGRIETGGGEGFRKGFWEASIREWANFSRPFPLFIFSPRSLRFSREIIIIID